MEPAAAKVAHAEIGVLGDCAFEIGAPQIGVTEGGPGKGAAAEVCADEDRISEIKVRQPETGQVLVGEIGAHPTPQAAQEALVPLDNRNEFLGCHAAIQSATLQPRYFNRGRTA